MGNETMQANCECVFMSMHVSPDVVSIIGSISRSKQIEQIRQRYTKCKSVITNCFCHEEILISPKSNDLLNLHLNKGVIVFETTFSNTRT